MASTQHCVAHFTDLSTRKSSFSNSNTNSSLFRRKSTNIVTRKKYHMFVTTSLSTNGCNGVPRAPVGTIETRTLPAVSTPALAMERLSSAVANLKSTLPSAQSGIIRLEVPIEEHIEALDWLHSQDQKNLLPRCYFSGRSQVTFSDFTSNDLTNRNGSAANGHLQRISTSFDDKNLASVAGVGSAALFRSPNPFSFDDWLSIKRFLSKNCPLIRAYGAIRFDARPHIAPEWKAFGSFYFVVPQVEFDELHGSSMIAATVAWDNALSLTYQQAIVALQTTMEQVSSTVSKLRQDVSHTSLVRTNIPDRTSWDLTLNRVLEEIGNKYSPLTKVVLARRSQVITTSDIDPLTWLSSFKADGKDAYQFCLQPHEAPAFIGNTPEQLFGRDQLTVFSEALAATRARGESDSLDLQMAHDLFSSPKDNHEFAIVRENIRQKLDAICTSVETEPMKSVRKLKRIQHLYARFAGRLRSEDDEFKILSSLHPTPAVCGFPMEDARAFIAENEMFDRGLYAGPVGFFGGAQSDFSVGIRSALIGKDAGALIYAGLGVVEGSDPALEWQELELKASQFMKLMKLEAPALK
uniref:isochorismate synthase n=1 Tax=Catharanthus roseus TaxID=4058 RepID=A0A3S8RJY8_CATRO|nr:isochorismate synthase [Catharanthus roseus]